MLEQFFPGESAAFKVGMVYLFTVAFYRLIYHTFRLVRGLIMIFVRAWRATEAELGIGKLGEDF